MSPRTAPTLSTPNVLDVVLPLMGNTRNRVAHAIRSLRWQENRVHRIYLVGQHPEDQLVELGLHFSSAQVSTVRLPAHLVLFGPEWWSALLPHLSAPWVGVQLPFAVSHSQRFARQIEFLQRTEATLASLTSARIADEDGLLSATDLPPGRQMDPTALNWGTACMKANAFHTSSIQNLTQDLQTGDVKAPLFHVSQDNLTTYHLPKSIRRTLSETVDVAQPFLQPPPDGPLPTVGVCIPGKNIEAFLPDALASLADQTHAPDEVMFIDDGSTDATAEIANQSSLVSTVLSGPKRWASGARNKGIRHMTSEIIVLLDGDDVLEPDWLARVAGVFGRHPDVGVMCGQYTYMDESGRRLFTRAPAVNDWTPEGLRQRNVMAGGAGFAFRRASFLETGGYNEKVRIGEDWDLWQRLVHRNGLMVANAPAYRIRSRRGSALRDGAFQEAEVWGLLRVEDVAKGKKAEAYQMILMDNAKRALAFGDSQYAREATQKAMRIGGKRLLEVLPLFVASHLPKNAQRSAFDLRRSLRRRLGTWLDENRFRPYGRKTKEPE